MQLYLNNKIESIPVFKTLIDLLRESDSIKDKLGDQYHELSEIYEVAHLSDPVRDYVEYQLMIEGPVDKGRSDYIVNALYAAKGSPLVFEVIKETLSQNIYYRYTFPVLNVVRLEELHTEDLITSVRKMKDMLYYLLYYIKASIYINNVILQLKGSKNLLITTNSFGYCYYQMNSVTYDIEGGVEL